MRVERFDNDNERGILISLINDPLVLGAVAEHWEFPGLFASPWCNDIGYWCVKHFKRYDKAPGKTIVDLFRVWAAKSQDQDKIKILDRFLDGLDFDKKPDPNTSYTLDAVGRYFNEVRRLQLADNVKNETKAGHDDKADELLSKHSRIELGEKRYVSLIQNEPAVRSIFQKAHRESLIRYPQGLGHFFRDYLRRGAFIGFMAPAKTGKTAWLVDLAYRGICEDRRVAFFSVGDETEEQIYERFVVRMCEHPINSSSLDGSWPCTIEIPTFLIAPEGRSERSLVGEVTHKIETFEAPLDEEEACQKMREIDKGFNGLDNFRVSVHNNLSISISGIKSILEIWAKGGWVADVVVIDYADNLAPVDNKEETRDRINTTWKLMRALSMSQHVLLVTATQTKMESYKAHWLTKSHFADDRRKVDQVTGFVGINVTTEEKRQGLCRLNWIVLRGGDFDETRGCYVAGCLALANPAVKSTF